MVFIIMDRSKKANKLSFDDNRNASEIRKIGKEINKAKAGGYNKNMIESSFGRDANKLLEKKPDRTLSREIAHDVVKQLKSY